MLNFNKFNKSMTLLSLVQVLKNVGKSQKKMESPKEKKNSAKIIDFLFFFYL